MNLRRPFALTNLLFATCTLLLSIAFSTPVHAQSVSFDGVGWTQQTPPTSPAMRYGAVMAYDTSTGQLVLFGGNGGSGFLDDTWTWDGSNWTQQTPPSSPAARELAAMAYDGSTGQLVLFGGFGNSGIALNDTWTWNGTNWAQQFPTNSPPTKADSAMAYDASAGQLVLFGGVGNNNAETDDTWTWDGTNWTQQFPTNSPPARYEAASAYDTSSGQLVLFGGNSNTVTWFDDTWTWDGTNWTQQFPPMSPAMRYGAVMAYDTSSGQLVLFGGDGSSNLIGDTWTWDGTNWNQLLPATNPPARFESAIAYDISTSQLVLFGGYGNSGSLDDTWTFQLGSVNFGNVNICPGGQTTPVPCNETLTLNYNVAVTTTFGAINVVTQGATNLDFTLSSGGTCTGTVSSGSICTVNVTFAPLAPGVRMGAVQLMDNSGNLLVTTMIHGVGQGPAIAFGPGVQNTIEVSGLGVPYDVAVDGAGDIFIADPYNSRVVEIPAGGGAQTTVGTGFDFPMSVAIDGAGDVFIADAALWEIPAGGGTQVVVGPEGTGVTVDGAGDVFIADPDNQRVVEIPAGGGAQTTIASGLMNPRRVAVDGAGDVFIADDGNSRVVEVPAGGGAQTTIASGLANPQGVAVDGAGNVFIADQDNNRVVEVPAGGGPQTTVGSGLFLPWGVTLDRVGNVFIADNNAQVIQVQRSQPPTLSFATTPAGSSSSDSPQSVTIQNFGNQPLMAVTPGLVVGGPNFLQVAGSGTPADCTASLALAPGATCNLSISFEPQSVGALTSTATFTDNALNTTPYAIQSIALQGTSASITQTITFTQNAPANAAYNSTFGMAASGGGSGNPVVFTSAGSCGNVGSLYTITSGTGTCSVIANQAGNSKYAPAAQVTQYVNATELGQTITFTVPAPATAKSGDTFGVAATGGASGNPVIFTSSGVCTNSGGTYTMTSNTGTCMVIANQAGNNNYAAATQVTESVTAVTTVTKLAPTVTFTGAPSSANYQSTFTVATTQNTGVTPTITAVGACKITGTTVTMTSGTGTCTLTAKWATDTYYLAATLTQRTTAQKLASGLSWTSPAAINYGTPLSVTELNATANVPGKFVYLPASGKVLASGTQNLLVTFTPTVTADYSTSTDTVPLVVNQVDTTTAITGSIPNPSIMGKPVKVSFGVTAAYGKPTGTVTVSSSTGESCTAHLSSGVGSCSITFATSGSRTLTGAYSGDTNDITSDSGGYTQNVNP
jgi:hypothetical protein